MQDKKSFCSQIEIRFFADWKTGSFWSAESVFFLFVLNIPECWKSLLWKKSFPVVSGKIVRKGSKKDKSMQKQYDAAVLLCVSGVMQRNNLKKCFIASNAGFYKSSIWRNCRKKRVNSQNTKVVLFWAYKVSVVQFFFKIAC